MEKLFQKLARYFLNLWHIGILDPQRGLSTIEPSLEKIAYLRARNARGCHIFIKPLYLAYYLLADDIDRHTLLCQHLLPNGNWKPGRMVVETSPENFQVWIHSSSPLSSEEKRRWLKRLRSDPAAHPENRWGRCPGFRNTKEKYRSPTGKYPLAKLIWIDWKDTVDIPSHPQTHICELSPLSLPPKGGTVCHLPTLSRDKFDKGDESATDFAYALSMFRRGFSDDQIRARILSERTSWTNHQGEKRLNHYLDRTIRRARDIVKNSPL